MKALCLFPKIENERFLQTGYLIKHLQDYKIHKFCSDTKILQTEFNGLALDASPGSRYRAYLKLVWNRQSNVIRIPDDQCYYQTPDANCQDGGRVRKFQMVRNEILQNSSFQKIIMANLEFIRWQPNFHAYTEFALGVHFIRYQAEQDKTAFSSPIWLHVDDEPLVFVHLIYASSNLIGGDNILANLNEDIQGVVRLEKFMDTLILNRNIRHAVTPMGSNGGTAVRDVILFTVEKCH